MNVRSGGIDGGLTVLDGQAVELCVECGFDGRRFPAGRLVDALGSLKWQWHEALGYDDAVVRRRPAERVWCAVEYAAHTRDVITSSAAAVHLMLVRDHPRLPDDAPSAGDPGGHRCQRFERETLAHQLGAAADGLAELLAGLTAAQLRRTGSVGGIDRNVAGIAAHAVHEASHHILDVRRGLAALLLQGALSS